MISQKFYKIWRVINAAMLIAGLLMPWVDISFEPIPAIVYGWEKFYWAIWFGGFGVLRFLESRYISLAIMDFLMGLSSIFLLYYLFYNIFSIQIAHKRNKVLSVIILCLTSTVLYDTFFGLWSAPFLGFWVFILGLLSSSLAEWGINYKTENDPDKLLPLSSFKIWRTVNMYTIVLGMMLMWNNNNFHNYFYRRYDLLLWQFEFFENDLPLYLSLLFGILFLYYLTFNLITIIEEKNIRDLRVVSLILFGMVPVCVFAWHTPDSYLGILGFLIIAIGLLSSAILEWQPRQFADIS